MEVLYEGKGELACCKKPMKLFGENTVDAAEEKHLPLVERIPQGIKVKVGSVAHLLEQKHFIERIKIITDGKARRLLKPSDASEAVCSIEPEQVPARDITRTGCGQG